MSDDQLIARVENVLERKLTPDERKFLCAATQLRRPKPSGKSGTRKANVRAA